MQNAETILFVDDEPKILEAYRRALRKQFRIKTAEGAPAALDMLKQNGEFAVMVTDCRMPGIDGIQLLSKTKTLYPSMVRVMLTGNVDKDTAVNAVNQGDIFKFANKPCSADDMTALLTQSLQQYRLQKAERDLLETTLKTSIATLSEVLGMTNPKLFGRIDRCKRLILDFARAHGVPITWEVEVIARLYHLGYVSMPDAMVQKLLYGQPLTTDEQREYQKHPGVASALLGKIPRMESVAQNIAYQNFQYDGSIPGQKCKREDIPVVARILKMVVDSENLCADDSSIDSVIEKMQADAHKYDPIMLPTFIELLKVRSQLQVKEISISELEENMIIACDMHSDQDVLLVCKGQEVTPSLLKKLVNFWRNGTIAEEISVVCPPDTDSE